MIYFLVGKSASGKDSIMAKLLEKNENICQIVLSTTRDIRPGETDGVEYHFKTDVDCLQDLKDGKVIECRSYTIAGGRVVYYYTSVDSIDLDKNYVTVGPPAMLKSYLDKLGQENIRQFYFTTPGYLRIKRSIFRFDRQLTDLEMEEICRRYLTDEEDYKQEILESCGINENNTFSNTFESSLDYIVDILNDISRHLDK